MTSHDRERCEVCDYPIIPGISACVNCGEPATRLKIEMDVDRGDVIDGLSVLEMIERNEQVRWDGRKMTEAQSLEYAGDTDGAITIYEELIGRRMPYTPPYRRLAIIYAKKKDTANEERVVRAALAVLSRGPADWFVVRLAKILARKRTA